MDNLQVLKDIYATMKESIRIEAAPMEDPKQPLKTWESKFGGMPYLPQGITYPKNNEGKPLYLLAQINLVDMPRLDPFPLDGILQFYIDDDDLYGMDFDGSNPNGFKVLYIPHSLDYNNQSDLSFLKKPEYFPIECEHRVKFSKSIKPVPISNPNFPSMFERYIDNDSVNLDFYDLYSSLIDDSNTHQIGGYPSFTQEGPSYLSKNNDLILLLQIGHDKKISFGDAGIATFFILKEDLINLNFSNVLYYWDCY